MLLITGEIASGKSRALHELEARPPLGWRPIYVPVPTLDLAGLVCWCLDRIGLPPGDDPVETLRSASAMRSFLILIDDAERLPVQTALGVRKLERDAGDHIQVVAACDAESAQSPPLVALGTPQETAKLGPGVDPGSAAARVRALLEPTPPAPARRMPDPTHARVRAAAQAAAEASARVVLPQRPVYVSPTLLQEQQAAAAREPEEQPARPPEGHPARALARKTAHPPEPAAKSPRAGARSAPLWTVVLIGLVKPLVFAVGFMLGRQSAVPVAPPAVPTAAAVSEGGAPAQSQEPEVSAGRPVAARAPASPKRQTAPARAGADSLPTPVMVSVGPAGDSPN